MFLFLNIIHFSNLFVCTTSLLCHSGSSVFLEACRIFSCGLWTLSCSMWDLVPWPGIESRPLALGAWILSHWITREAPEGQFWSSCWEALELTILIWLMLSCPDSELLGQHFPDGLTASIDQRQMLPDFLCKPIFVSLFSYRLFYGTFALVSVLELFHKILRAYIVWFTPKTRVERNELLMLECRHLF